jgi:hypothetical protein
MRITGKSGLAAAIPLLLAATTAGSAAAAPDASISSGITRDLSATAPSAEDLPFTFSISNLPAGKTFEVVYSANETGLSGYAQASSGSMTGAGFASNSLYLTASTGGPLHTSATVILSVGTAPVTGTASVPSGATVTLTNGLTSQTITLASGSFSIPSGVGVGTTGPGEDVSGPGLFVTGPPLCARPATRPLTPRFSADWLETITS